MKTSVTPELANSYESEGYEDREIGTYELQRRLDAHGCGWHFVNGELFAGNALNNEDIVSTADWTLFDLLSYLNY